jgi:hypothetical protein
MRDPLLRGALLADRMGGRMDLQHDLQHRTSILGAAVDST